MSKYNSYFIIFLFLPFLIYPQQKINELNNPLLVDNYNFISINQIKMWVSNNGKGSFNPTTGGAGFYWPGGQSATQTAIFSDGLVWGGKVNGQIRVNGNTHRAGLQSGKILESGLADNPSLLKYRVYKILKGWENLPPGPVRDAYELDYNEWPVVDGAPWIDIDQDGVYTPGIDQPHFIGDEVMWYVANDLDSAITANTYGGPSLGLEFQTTVYAFDSTNFLGDVVFKKYRIINKGNEQIDSLFFSYWYDSDIGDANDDFSGTNPYYNLGYTYNRVNTDAIYGPAPPAVGHMLVQGPIIPSSPDKSAYFNGEWIHGFENLPISSYMFYIKGSNFYKLPDNGYNGGIQFYNNMKGLIWTGDSIVNPVTNQSTIFPLNGKPGQSGWYEGYDGSGFHGSDRYAAINSGPVTMAVGDTQEVVIAIFMAKGTDNIQSVYTLFEKAELIQNFYGAFVPNITSVNNNENNIPNNFVLEQNYPNPFNPSTEISYQLSEDRKVSLIVYDILGNVVATLVNENQSAGKYSISFNAANLSSGVYFYKIVAGDFVETKKMVLIK